MRDSLSGIMKKFIRAEILKKKWMVVNFEGTPSIYFKKPKCYIIKKRKLYLNNAYRTYSVEFPDDIIYVSNPVLIARFKRMNYTDFNNKE